jgi:hypothetical protein
VRSARHTTLWPRQHANASHEAAPASAALANGTCPRPLPTAPALSHVLPCVRACVSRHRWSKGTIVEKLGPDERPQFRVDYGDDFAMAHDLTSSDKFAKPYRLVAPPPPPPTRLMRVKTALRARAKLAMLGGGAVVAVVAVVVALMLQEQ